jgi:thymidylate synthase
MKQYLDLLAEIIKTGVEKESGRANMPNTIGISKGEISMNLQDGFPLLTTKKMYWKGIVQELLWFLHGDTNIKYLVDNNVNIWNDDAYRWYLGRHNYQDNLREDQPYDKEKFLLAVQEQELCPIHGYEYGDLGKVYGYQWRDQNGVDQIKKVIEGLKNNPYSRYHIINAWNAADFDEMALPPCHLLYQFIVRPLTQKEREEIAISRGLVSKAELATVVGKEHAEKDYVPRILDVYNIPKFYLDLNMYQRSCDTFLGVPFNIASMSILLMIVAKVSNMIPGIANWIGGDTHIYVDHRNVVIEQLGRTPHPLPKLIIKKELKSLDDILALTIDDFELIDYKCYDSIKAELFTGLKKK